MSENEEDRERGFKVADRRRFADTGEPRAEESAQPDTDQHPVPPPARDPQTSADHRSAQITFPMFVLSLSTQALAHLGEIPDPIEGSTRVDLAAAQEIIDILALLQQKTRGNLEPDESSQLDSALYVLRLKYVDCSQRR